MSKFVTPFKIHIHPCRRFRMALFTSGKCDIGFKVKCRFDINHILTSEDDHGPFHGHLPRFPVHTQNQNQQIHLTLSLPNLTKTEGNFPIEKNSAQGPQNEI